MSFAFKLFYLSSGFTVYIIDFNVMSRHVQIRYMCASVRCVYDSVLQRPEVPDRSLSVKSQGCKWRIKKEVYRISAFFSTPRANLHTIILLCIIYITCTLVFFFALHSFIHQHQWPTKNPLLFYKNQPTQLQRRFCKWLQTFSLFKSNFVFPNKILCKCNFFFKCIFIKKKKMLIHFFMLLLHCQKQKKSHFKFVKELYIPHILRAF